MRSIDVWRFKPNSESATLGNPIPLFGDSPLFFHEKSQFGANVLPLIHGRPLHRFPFLNHGRLRIHASVPLQLIPDRHSIRRKDFRRRDSSNRPVDNIFEGFPHCRQDRAVDGDDEAPSVAIVSASSLVSPLVGTANVDRNIAETLVQVEEKIATQCGGGGGGGFFRLEEGIVPPDVFFDFIPSGWNFFGEFVVHLNAAFRTDKHPSDQLAYWVGEVARGGGGWGGWRWRGWRASRRYHMLRKEKRKRSFKIWQAVVFFLLFGSNVSVQGIISISRKRNRMVREMLYPWETETVIGQFFQGLK